MSILERCPSDQESNKGNKERLGPTLGVRLIESQIEGVKKGRNQLWVSVLQRCPSYRESNKASKERQGPTIGVRFSFDFFYDRDCSEHEVRGDEPHSLE